MGNDDPVTRLSMYLIRAQMFQHDMLEIPKEHGRKKTIDDDALRTDFFSYMDAWLSGLYVVVEGYRQLNLKDETIDELLSEGTKFLQDTWEQTNFFKERPTSAVQQPDRMRWAEALTDEFVEFFKRYFRAKGVVP